MRLVLRRKRTWLLALLAMAILGAAGIVLTASVKSDFEKQYDQLQNGMTIDDAVQLMQPSKLTVIRQIRTPGGTFPSPLRIVLDEDEEVVFLDFESGRLSGRDFRPPDVRGRLRRLWQKMFNSVPPF